jgi:hypothetical protein
VPWEKIRDKKNKKKKIKRFREGRNDYNKYITGRGAEAPASAALPNPKKNLCD